MDLLNSISILSSFQIDTVYNLLILNEKLANQEYTNSGNLLYYLKSS
jgi:hypothetical protein